MPMPNFHSCRLKPPNYDKYAYEKCKAKHDGKCIDFVYGIKGENESELQSMRYPMDIWTEEDAKAHCKENDGTFEPGKEEESFLEPERRYMPFTEMRALEEESKLIIEGYPIVYEQYANLWGFKEIIHKGAAGPALKRSEELVLWDHESGQPMAAKKNGTLEAKEDEKGVFIRADVSKTIWGRQGYEAIKNGIIDKMSFAFDMKRDGEKWTDKEVDGVMIEVREIFEFWTIYDYSPVSYPAYEQTLVTARSKELALRNRPKPEASGEASAAALKCFEDARDNIGQRRKI